MFSPSERQPPGNNRRRRRGVTSCLCEASFVEARRAELSPTYFALTHKVQNQYGLLTVHFSNPFSQQLNFRCARSNDLDDDRLLCAASVVAKRGLEGEALELCSDQLDNSLPVFFLCIDPVYALAAHGLYSDEQRR